MTQPNFIGTPQGGVYPQGFDPRMLPVIQKLQQTNPTLWQQVVADSLKALPPPTQADFTVNPQGVASPAGIQLDMNRAQATAPEPLQLEYKPGLGFKGEKLRPGFGAEAAAGGEAAAGARGIGSALGGVGKFLGPVGTAVAGAELLNSPPNYFQGALGAGKDGQPLLKGVSPSQMASGMEPGLMKNLTDIVGTGLIGDPKVSRFEEKFKQLLAAPITLPATAVMKSKDMLSSAGNWLFGPQEQKPNGPQMQTPSAFEAFANLQGSLPKDGTVGATNSFDIPGQTGLLPAPPQQGMPGKVDTSAVQGWLEKAAPKAPQEDGDSGKLMTALGLLQGAAGADFTHGFGQGLAQIGAGALGGLVQGKQQKKKEQQDYEKAQQNYAALMAGHSLDIAKLDAEHQEKLLDVSFKNAMLKYETALKNIELTKPKFIGMEGGVAMYQTTDPNTGAMKLNSFDTGLLKQQAMLKMMLRGQTGLGGTKIADLTASSMVPGAGHDAFSYYSNIASDVLNSSLGSVVLDQKTWDQLEQDAMMKAQQTPGTEAEKNAAYKSYIVGHTAGLMMNNPQLVSKASPYSMWARGLLPFLNPQPTGGTGGQK